MRAANAFNLNRPHSRSRSLSRRHCSLAVALHARSHGLSEVHVGMDRMCPSFEVYGKWSVQTDSHTRAQCSHASVGLAQAHLNHGVVRTTVHVHIYLINRMCFNKHSKDMLGIILCLDSISNMPHSCFIV